MIGGEAVDEPGPKGDHHRLVCYSIDNLSLLQTASTPATARATCWGQHSLTILRKATGFMIAHVKSSNGKTLVTGCW